MSDMLNQTAISDEVAAKRRALDAERAREQNIKVNGACCATTPGYELREARHQGMYHAQLVMLRDATLSVLKSLRERPDAHSYQLEKAIIHIEDAVTRIEKQVEESTRRLG